MAENAIVPPAPFESLNDVWLAFRDLIAQLGPLAQASMDEGPGGRGWPVGIDVVPIAHELGLVPRLAFASASNAALVENTGRDSNYTYWRASVPTFLKLVLVP